MRAALLAMIAAALPAMAAAQTVNDFPTEARADYVFACMATNGQTRAVLQQCACSVDVIASILPYEAYVRAETVLSVRQAGGERTQVFRGNEIARGAVADLRRAQAEAEIRCFQ